MEDTFHRLKENILKMNQDHSIVVDDMKKSNIMFKTDISIDVEKHA